MLGFAGPFPGSRLHTTWHWQSVGTAIRAGKTHFSTLNSLPPCSAIWPSFFTTEACLQGCIEAATTEEWGKGSTVIVFLACSSLTSSMIWQEHFLNLACTLTENWIRRGDGQQKKCLDWIALAILTGNIRPYESNSAKRWLKSAHGPIASGIAQG